MALYRLDYLDPETGKPAATQRFSFRSDELAVHQAELLSVGLPMVLRAGARHVQSFGTERLGANA